MVRDDPSGCRVRLRKRATHPLQASLLMVCLALPWIAWRRQGIKRGVCGVCPTLRVMVETRSSKSFYGFCMILVKGHDLDVTGAKRGLKLTLSSYGHSKTTMFLCLQTSNLDCFVKPGLLFGRLGSLHLITVISKSLKSHNCVNCNFIRTFRFPRLSTKTSPSYHGSSVPQSNEFSVMNLLQQSGILRSVSSEKGEVSSKPMPNIDH